MKLILQNPGISTGMHFKHNFVYVVTKLAFDCFLINTTMPQQDCPNVPGPFQALVISYFCIKVSIPISSPCPTRSLEIKNLRILAFHRV